MRLNAAAEPDDMQTVKMVKHWREEAEMVVGSLDELLQRSTRVAARNIAVLVTGETGVGKELFVRRLHRLSGRSGHLQVVNCAALPPELTESLLFGHERGAFTGADRSTLGFCDKAQGGTLFLDEIGELGPRAQAALLRVLQEGRIQSVGSTIERDVDIRIVSATHRDLEALVAAGSFRADLLYRLNAAVFHLPPLRERRAEIPALAAHFRHVACEEWGVCGVELSSAALAKLQGYSWPGNIRQLQNVVRSVVATADSHQVIDVSDLPPWLDVAVNPDSDRGEGLGAQENLANLPLRQLAHEYEGTLIAEALRRSDGSISRAAQLLGLPVRTLSYRMRLHNLDRPALRGVDDNAPSARSGTIRFAPRPGSPSAPSEQHCLKPAVGDVNRRRTHAV